MAEVLFFLFLAAPFLLMGWMIVAKRRADALHRARPQPREPGHSTLAYDEVTANADGLLYGKRYEGDDALRPAADHTGMLDGIKALDGKR